MNRTSEHLDMTPYLLSAVISIHFEDTIISHYQYGATRVSFRIEVN